MPDLLLWKVLAENDHNAMNGKAKQSASGGGAMHIALGVDRDAFPIKDFLGTASHSKTVSTEPWLGHFPASSLTFDGNPSRRNGEWRITDQFHHRHPAWWTKVGFPANYTSGNRPVLFVARANGKFHPRFAMESALAHGDDDLGALIAGKAKGVALLSPTWAKALDIADLDTNLSRYEEAVEAASKKPGAPFIPGSLDDARKRIVREIVRRQGQQGFRKKLLKSYQGCCAISGCDIESALEAAHISPYRGQHTNHVTNGILLRADLHTLFDLGLITVTPKEHKIRVSPQLKPPHYQALDGKKIKEPTEGISDEALEEHGNLFIA